MTASAFDAADAVPAGASRGVSTAMSETRGAPGPAAVHREAVSAWAWVALIVLLIAAVAGTATLLLVQWTASGSGTVAG